VLRWQARQGNLPSLNISTRFGIISGRILPVQAPDEPVFRLDFLFVPEVIL